MFYYKILLSLVLIFSTSFCYGGSVIVKDESYDKIQYEALITLHLNLLALQNNQTPTPDEDDKIEIGSTCPVCKGRGTSGDGIQECAKCGGDGVIDKGDLTGSFGEFDPTPKIQVETVTKYYLKYNGYTYYYNSLDDKFVCPETGDSIGNLPPNWKAYGLLRMPQVNRMGKTTGFQSLRIYKGSFVKDHI